MKETQFVLEFTSHVLANSTNSDGKKDMFQRDSDNKLIFQQSWWYSAFTKAIELAHLRGVKPGDISMDLTVDAPTQLYNRRYGDSKVRTHESIVPGTAVTFNAVVSDHVTESVLRLILEKMGTFVGLSPYGFRLGYGKFKVRSVTVTPSEGAQQ